nr:hypothetical protein [Saprospiraceae bacterium]
IQQLLKAKCIFLQKLTTSVYSLSDKMNSCNWFVKQRYKLRTKEFVDCLKLGKVMFYFKSLMTKRTFDFQ